MPANITQHQHIIAQAEELLSKRFGGQQVLKDVVPLSGSGSATVLRAKVAASPFLQARSLVVKHIPQTGQMIDRSMLLREIIAYQFTTSLSPDVRPGPVLLAYDVEQQLLVISDSGEGDAFSELLRSNDQDLRFGMLRNLGEAIGKMHAATATQEQNFDILLRRMLQKHPEAAPMHAFRERLLQMSMHVGVELVTDAGITVRAAISALVDEAARRLARGQHRAFTPFDLSPDNIIVSDRTHFLDYEWAGFRDVTFDIACVIAGFPQYLASRPISDDEADELIEAWVGEVGATWPNVRNTTRLHARLLISLIGWSLSGLAMMHIGTDTAAFEELYARSQRDGLEAITVDVITDAAKRHVGNLLTEPVRADETEEYFTMIRLDLMETFEALQRFSRRETDPRFGEAEGLADSVLECLRSATQTR